MWDSKMWYSVPRDSFLRMTALATASSNRKRQTHPLVREDVTLELWPQVSAENKILLAVSLMGLGAKTNWLEVKVSRKVTLTLTLTIYYPNFPDTLISIRFIYLSYLISAFENSLYVSSSKTLLVSLYLCAHNDYSPLSHYYITCVDLFVP
jgi:hypothetical protein